MSSRFLAANEHPQQPRLAYFITRTNGFTVPLTPIDELPYSVQIEGVTRNMSPEQTFGMQFIGTFPYSGMLFRSKLEAVEMQRTSSQPSTPVHQQKYSNGKRYMAPDAFARQTTNNARHFSHNLGVSRSPVSTSTDDSHAASASTHRRAESTPTRPLTDPQAFIDAIVSSKLGAEAAARVGYVSKSASPTLAPPSGKVPDPNNKTHCTHWLRTGECDYTQQGCMYKHEKPNDKVLKELSFRSTPRWYLEKGQTVKLNGERPIVGSLVRSRDWLRKASVATTDSEGSEAGSGMSERDGKGVQVPVNNVAAQKMVINLKKPSQQQETTPTAMNIATAMTGVTKFAMTTDTGNLVDFDSCKPSSSSADAASTAPASIKSSTSVSPSRSKTSCSSSSSSAQKPKKEFSIPKGESSTKHLADHAFRQRRSNNRRSKPSEAHIASLEKQIQQESTSNRSSGVRATGGLMVSRHAPAQKQSARTSMGPRVRKPALQCVEISQM